MKISKTIREYIEEQVRIKAEQSTRLVELEQRANEVRKNFSAEREKIEKEYRKAIEELAKKYNISEKRSAYEGCLPEVIEYNKVRDELYAKRRLAVLNIIAEMELGGTKTELMEKLNNLTF